MGGREVDGCNQRVAGCAAAGICFRRRAVDDQRHLDGGLVEKILFALPVVAQIVAVIRGDDDHAIDHVAGFLEESEQAAHLVVGLLDQAHIGGNHLGADILARKGLAHG